LFLTALQSCESRFHICFVITFLVTAFI